MRCFIPELFSNVKAGFGVMRCFIPELFSIPEL